MLSSKMCTARSLAVSRSIPLGWSTKPPRGKPLSGCRSPAVDRMTDRSKDITCPKLRLRAVKRTCRVVLSDISHTRSSSLTVLLVTSSRSTIIITSFNLTRIVFSNSAFSFDLKVQTHSVYHFTSKERRT